MRVQTFGDWLLTRMISLRQALIALYEQRDKLLYVEAPPLRQRYMDAIGKYEEEVLQAELDTQMLRRKAELIRIAKNRREPVNIQAIEASLEAEKQKKIREIESSDRTLNELPTLTDSERVELQQNYHEITSVYHPALNKDLTDTQKELYVKALDAYKMQDKEAVKLIHDMLFTPENTVRSSSFVDISVDQDDADERRKDYREIASLLTTDYGLAKLLYEFFLPLEEDMIVNASIEEYEAQLAAIEGEINQIKTGFPFNARATMDSKEKTEDYLAELRIRAKQCEAEKAELESQIAQMTEA